MGAFFSQHNELFDEDITHGSGHRLSNESPFYKPRSTFTMNSDHETPIPRVLEWDPRSPTEGITRTPIEVLSVPKGRQAVQSDLPYEHTPSMVSDPIHKFLWIDPRSPALGFTRTPIRFLDVNDSAEEINDEDIEKVSHMTLADESTEEDYLDASDADIEQVLDAALVDESTEDDHCDPSRTAEDIEDGLGGALVGAESIKCHDVSRTAEDIDQVSTENDASQTAKCVDQESHVALVAESTGKDHVQVASAKEERVDQEISQAIDVGCKSSADKHISEVATPLGHTTNIDCMPTSRVNDLKKEAVNTSGYSLDMPKSIDKVKQFLVDKENSSSVKKQEFYTPEKKAEDGAKPKVRTPLGTVCENNSPMHMLRDKQSNVVKKSLSARPPQFIQLNRTAVDRP